MIRAWRFVRSCQENFCYLSPIFAVLESGVGGRAWMPFALLLGGQHPSRREVGAASFVFRE